MLAGKKDNTEKNVNYRELLMKDQLRRQKALKDTFLTEYEEGPITFPPTYKLGTVSLIQG